MRHSSKAATDKSAGASTRSARGGRSTSKASSGTGGRTADRSMEDRYTYQRDEEGRYNQPSSSRESGRESNRDFGGGYDREHSRSSGVGSRFEQDDRQYGSSEGRRSTGRTSQGDFGNYGGRDIDSHRESSYGQDRGQGIRSGYGSDSDYRDNDSRHKSGFESDYGRYQRSNVDHDHETDDLRGRRAFHTDDDDFETDTEHGQYDRQQQGSRSRDRQTSSRDRR